RHAEMAKVLGLAHVCEQDARSPRLGLEVCDRRRDRTAVDVVREQDDEALLAHELARKAQGLRDAARALLARVLDVVAEVAAKVVDVVAARHEQEVADPGLRQRIGCPLALRLLAEGEKVLVRDFGERIEPGAGPAGQDDALHADAMLWESWS